MKLVATNNFVITKRDETEKTVNGLVLPSGSRIKPNRATILSVGDLVKDKNICKGVGKTCLFYKTVGFEIEFEGYVYLYLTGDEIISIV